MSTQPQSRGSGPSPQVSPAPLSLFTLYLNWYVPRHFHSLRVAHAERFPRDSRPLIACINHPSWWDPLTILMLSQFLSPGRFAYAPMEAEALSHYGFFRKIGAFPVDNTSPRAAAQFLRQASDVLARPEAILWMTPEGQFTDVRRRPLEWKPGTAALTRHLEDCTVVPLAIEYTFWDERLPEILCSVGEPLLFTSSQRESTTERTIRLAAAMTAAQDELANRALKRDGSLFTSVFSGSAGVSVTYDVWLRIKSLLTGRPYVAEHRAITEVRSVAHK